MISCTHCREDISEGYCEECYNEAYESLKQRQEGKVLVDESLMEDIKWVIEMFEPCLKAATRGGEHWDRLMKIKEEVV